VRIQQIENSWQTLLFVGMIGTAFGTVLVKLIAQIRMSPQQRLSAADRFTDRVVQDVDRVRERTERMEERFNRRLSFKDRQIEDSRNRYYELREYTSQVVNICRQMQSQAATLQTDNNEMRVKLQMPQRTFEPMTPLPAMPIHSLPEVAPEPEEEYEDDCDNRPVRTKRRRTDALATLQHADEQEVDR